MIYTFEKETLALKINDEVNALAISKIVGVSTSPTHVYVETSEDFLGTELEQVQTVVNSHDKDDLNYIRAAIPDLTPRQFRQAMFLTGITEEQVLQVINAQTEPTKTLALIEWEYSTAFVRTNQFLNQLLPFFGLSQADLDDLWELGATL